VAKKRTVYVCSECGAGQPKWLGQCPECRAWNTLTAMVVESPQAADARSLWRLNADGQQARPLSEVVTAAVQRVRLPIAELDRVLGGGIVPGSLVLLGGEPGIGKSTLILQASALLSRQLPPVLYVSGEESAQQIRLRAERMGQVSEALYVLAETDMAAILREVESLKPRAIIVDSIQTVYLDELASSAGSVTQVRECAARFMRLAKGGDHVPIFLVGHVTKSGDIAGPRILEHMVDTVLYLEGDRFHSYRLLRCVKNRFGSTNEVGVFEMRQDGLVEIPNPSAAFLAERLAGVAGSAVTVTVEGSRPLLVEVQALVSPSGMQVPRRTAGGVEPSRLVLLGAVLAKRLGLPLGNQDIFVNVVGGLRVVEPAVDLALATAICSSTHNLPIPEDLVIVGEVGLSGELRSVSQLERRLAEAASLGFRRALLPATGLRSLGDGHGLELLGARTLGDALDLALRDQS
jgi:DNA repair protein RadA/Sms